MVVERNDRALEASVRWKAVNKTYCIYYKTQTRGGDCGWTSKFTFCMRGLKVPFAVLKHLNANEEYCVAVEVVSTCFSGWVYNHGYNDDDNGGGSNEISYDAILQATASIIASLFGSIIGAIMTQLIARRCRSAARNSE